MKGLASIGYWIVGPHETADVQDDVLRACDREGNLPVWEVLEVHADHQTYFSTAEAVEDALFTVVEHHPYV